MKTILTVDVGGTKILIGEVDFSGMILSKIKRPSDISTQKAAMNQIIDVIKSYIRSNTIGDIQAIAIDTVGRVNNDDGIWYEIDYKNKEKIDVSALIRKQFGFPCYVINDLAAATFAEKKIGVGTITNDFIYLSIGTGIAGRIVFNGNMILGEDYDAGEFCHMVVNSESNVKCICGRYGCVEPLASGLGMSKRAHDLADEYDTTLKIVPDKRVNGKDLFHAYDNKDPLALEVVNQSLEATSNLVMNLVKSVNPKAVRFGGGILTGDWYINKLQKFLDPTTMRFVNLEVKKTSLDANLIALQGCALYAVSRL